MIDSGAEINLIKETSIPKTLKPYPFKLVLRGICGGKSLTLGVIKCKIGKTTTIFHVIKNEDQFHCDGILGAEFLRDSDASISFGEEAIKIDKTKIEFIPIAKSVKSSMDLINAKRNNFQNDNVLKYACIPEIGINIIGQNKNDILKTAESNPQKNNIQLKSEIEKRLNNLEDNIQSLKSDLNIRSRLFNVEKDVKRLLSKNNSVSTIQETTIQNSNQTAEKLEIYNNYLTELENKYDINYLHIQMAEYEIIMKKLESRTRLQKFNMYEPIHLNFCKTPKIFHYV